MHQRMTLSSPFSSKTLASAEQLRQLRGIPVGLPFRDRRPEPVDRQSKLHPMILMRASELRCELTFLAFGEHITNICASTPELPPNA